MNGFLLVDKPVDLSSHQIVSGVRRLFNTKKVGHTGTLDPFATGLLVVGLGEALKFLHYLLEEPKVYLATVRLGMLTDTLDHTGTVLASMPPPVLLVESIKETILQKFIGEQLQTPPMYSAKKVDGQKLYDLARAGIEVERDPVKITIESLEVVSWNAPDLTFRVQCSRGTYVRVIGDDLAQSLGTRGTLIELRRVAAGPVFSVDHALSWNNRDTIKDFSAFSISIEQALSHWPKIKMSDEESKDLICGRKLLARVAEPQGIVTLFDDKGFLGVGENHEVLKSLRLMTR